MNEHEDKGMSLKEKVVRGIGERLAKMAVSPRGCWAFPLHEPELSPEMIEELGKIDNY